MRFTAVFLAIAFVPLVSDAGTEAATARPIAAAEAPALKSTTFASKAPSENVERKSFTPTVRGFKEGVSTLIKSDDTGELFRNADGTKTAKIRANATNDSGTPRRDVKQLQRNKAGQFESVNEIGSVKLAPNASSAGARVARGNASIDFGLRASSNVPGIQVGDSVEYRDVAPGVDLVYSTTEGLPRVQLTRLSIDYAAC